MSTSFSLLSWLFLSWMYPLIINHRFTFMRAGERNRKCTGHHQRPLFDWLENFSRYEETKRAIPIGGLEVSGGSGWTSQMTQSSAVGSKTQYI